MAARSAAEVLNRATVPLWAKSHGPAAKGWVFSAATFPTLASRTWASTRCERAARAASTKARSAWAGRSPLRTRGSRPTYQPMPQPWGWRWDWKRSALVAPQSGSQ
jgi:hypothetical protein